MEYAYGISDDYLDEDDDGVMYSTKTYSSESEDEMQLLPTRQTVKKEGACNHGEDAFDKEMAAELQATMKKLTTPFPSSSDTQSTEQKPTNDPLYYDKIYFDSDESDSEEDVSKSNPDKRKAKHKILDNDQLFYDPLMDDADQAFVDRQRRKYQLKANRQKGKKGEMKSVPLPHSDAVLNCPACFTTLCLDCQRHEIYKNQYRAMFVFNCCVDKSEILHFSVKEERKNKLRKGRRKKQKPNLEKSHEENSAAEGGTEAEATADDFFNPVKCTVCNTKVAVQDKDEVYHFFNVITSY